MVSKNFLNVFLKIFFYTYYNGNYYNNILESMN